MNDTEKPADNTRQEKGVADSQAPILWEQRLWCSLWSSWSRLSKKTRQYTLWLLIGAILTALGPYTITHKYGPYFGKIVDLETGEPLGGGVVLIYFCTELHTPAGRVTKFVDSLETSTNNNGEFSIPTYRGFAFRFPHSWANDGRITIFKPGYGNFPWHHGVQPKFTPFYSFPPKEYVSIKLPRLKTTAEAYDNLNHLPVIHVPREKMRMLLKLIEKEQSTGLTYYH